MTDNRENSGHPADDMAEYLQTFIDETEEQLDDLVETMLALEQDSANKDDLNEAFRLIHSIKGSAGMMGFESIAMLTHHLENRFERFRSGTQRLNESTMNVVLRCVDFLRQCNNRLRDGEQLDSSAELLDEIKRLETEKPEAPDIDSPELSAREQRIAGAVTTYPTSRQSSEEPEVIDDAIRIVVRFRSGLQLADLKAQLIVARLSGLGEVKSTCPDVQELADVDSLDSFEVRIETHEGLEVLRAATDVDGVESIELGGPSAESVTDITAEEEDSEPEALTVGPAPSQNDSASFDESAGRESDTTSLAPSKSKDESAEASTVASTEAERRSSDPTAEFPQQMETSQPLSAGQAATKVPETMRVDIDRLDNLMNLAGELVVNRARFVQISGQISPALRKASILNRIRDFSDSLRRTITSLEEVGDNGSDRSVHITHLRAGLELLEEQCDVWDKGRHCFSQIGEAIDQLSRVSNSLQHGVLDTRMVPVAPLFHRFKRVVRDLSKERGKKADLIIRGEKTELDKRMIDELGDPLVHLVRNSIDHGLESPDVRVSRGKPEVGTIYLEARHSGNSVFIHVSDDGEGIDVGKIRAKLVDRQILSEPAVEELSDELALDYIWHPGFSTAKEVTDVSGRGVGMDVVKTRINQLNGTIELDSTPQRGTSFSIRLPLTLAIITSLLVRLKNVFFSIPIDDVREIVSVHESDVVTVHGKQTFDVRGEFIPLFHVENVFQWHGIDYGHAGAELANHEDPDSKTVKVVVLHTGGRTMGLRVDELLGSQDIVIKSLSDNFISIRGLSGASILGDGRVCLMLDVGPAIELAIRSSRAVDSEEVPT